MQPPLRLKVSPEKNTFHDYSGVYFSSFVFDISNHFIWYCVNIFQIQYATVHMACITRDSSKGFPWYQFRWFCLKFVIININGGGFFGDLHIPTNWYLNLMENLGGVCEFTQNRWKNEYDRGDLGLWPLTLKQLGNVFLNKTYLPCKYDRPLH